MQHSYLYIFILQKDLMENHGGKKQIWISKMAAMSEMDKFG